MVFCPQRSSSGQCKTHTKKTTPRYCFFCLNLNYEEVSIWIYTAQNTNMTMGKIAKFEAVLLYLLFKIGSFDCDLSELEGMTTIKIFSYLLDTFAQTWCVTTPRGFHGLARSDDLHGSFQEFFGTSRKTKREAKQGFFLWQVVSFWTWR